MSELSPLAIELKRLHTEHKERLKLLYDAYAEAGIPANERYITSHLYDRHAWQIANTVGNAQAQMRPDPQEREAKNG